MAGPRLLARCPSRVASCAAPRASTSSTAPRCGAPISSRSSRTSGSASAMHSIVGQGKVEQVLASKPEDRRAFVEEAAGLGKFKRRRHRAELKLARVALQVERARDVEEEVRKRLRPLALQATAAERAEKLGIEIAALRARIAQLDLADSGSRRAEAEERRDTAAFAKRGAQGRLEGFSAIGREPRRSSRTRQVAARPRLRLATGCRAASSGSSCGPSRRRRCLSDSGPRLLPLRTSRTRRATLARLELEAARAAEAARSAERERVALAERAALVRERVRALEQALAEQEGLPPAARALAEDGARLALAALDVAAGRRARGRRGPARAGVGRARGRSGGRARAAPAGSRRRPRQPHRPRGPSAAGARGRVSGRPAR